MDRSSNTLPLSYSRREILLVFICMQPQRGTVHLPLIFDISSTISRTLMDLSPFRQNFEKNQNRQKNHHSLKEHLTFTKIAKFGCEML